MAKATNTPRSSTTKAATAVPDLAAGLAAGTVTIEAIDPQTAQLDPNVRTNPTLSDGFIESIRAEGVREPVLARRGEDGTVFVWDGQRRLLAAREAGIPAMLAVFGIADSTGTAAIRMLDQLRTLARTDLTLSDRLAAYEQLALDGITVETIAKSAGAVAPEVRTVEMSWIIDPAHGGQGYATEASLAMAQLAFGVLHARIVAAVIRTGNTRSFALARRLGFRETHRGHRSVLLTLSHIDLLDALADRPKLRGILQAQP
jgi:hypothetical protein